MTGCPNCGAERLKAAPVPLIDPVLNVFSSRRRYRCSGCGWTGRRRRLKRRSHELSSPRVATAKGVGLFAIVIVLLISGGLYVQSCVERPAKQVEVDGTQ